MSYGKDGSNTSRKRGRILYSGKHCVRKLKPNYIRCMSGIVHFLFSVTLYASSPSYFRGFTLIALKEGKDGDKDEDYAGNFQVRLRK